MAGFLRRFFIQISSSSSFYSCLFRLRKRHRSASMLRSLHLNDVRASRRWELLLGAILGRLRPTVLLVGVLAGPNRLAKVGQCQTFTRRSLSWGGP